MKIENLITEHLDLWSAAVRPKSSAGRGASSKLELTGIKKLRELILELAVRGKLVSQDPCDEPASVLLERIAAEKARLVKEGKLKKPKALPEISEEEQPFDLPEGWAWGSIGYITEFVNGYAFKSSDFASEGVGIVKIGDIQDGEIVVDNMSRVSQHVVDGLNENLQVKSGDMLIAMSGATTGKLGFNKTDEIFYLNQRVGKFITYLVDKEFLYYPLATKIAENLAKAMGSAIPNISTKQINEITIALPPLAEQHRIVAKVDELMALCDQLEQCSESQLAAHQTLVEALLATLTDSSDTEELAQNWARLSTHFDTLFTTERSIDALKQTIMQLAVMGKLVPQDPSDEPASALLERIAAEKAQLIKEKKIKKEKPLPAISEDEQPFELPKGWEWCRLGALMPQFQNGASSRGDSGGIPITVLRLADIKDWKVSLADTRELSIDSKSIDKYSLEKGDTLIIRVNGSSDIVGRFIGCDENYDAIYCDHFIRMRFLVEVFNTRYLSLLGSLYINLCNCLILICSIQHQKQVTL
ncbi:restriction endonuclease subunit S [Edwardsiella ictaluri]|uniref:restriction endonuclease subunit S n=1 Tax=Edwardsiella ictaluri TaxID=67780 RepID=UPI0039F712D7